MALLFLSIKIPDTFLWFGHPQEEGSYMTYLLKDPLTGNVAFWDANTWMHLCLSFDKQTRKLLLVKVCPDESAL